MSSGDAVAVTLLDPLSAVPFYCDRLSRALASTGAAVDLHCAPFPYHRLPAPRGYRRQLSFARFLNAPALAAIAGSPGARRAGRALTYLFDWARVERSLERRPAEVVHLQWSADARTDAWWLRRLRRAGARVVLTLHNARRRSDAPGRDGAEAALVASADAVVTLGASVARQIAALVPCPGPRVEVIPPGVPERPLRPIDPAAARARWGLPAEAPVALFFGLVRPYKGVDLLEAAFERVRRDLPTATLVVAGLGRGGEAGRSGEWLRRIDRYVEEGEAEELFAACDVVVLPYREGSASAVVLEAWRHERLPIASAIGALGEQVVDGVTGRAVAAGEVEPLACRLTEALADRGGTRAAGREAAAAARRLFPPEREAAAHLALYREILRPVRAA